MLRKFKKMEIEIVMRHQKYNLNKWANMSHFWWNANYHKEINSYKLIYGSVQHNPNKVSMQYCYLIKSV